MSHVPSTLPGHPAAPAAPRRQRSVPVLVPHLVWEPLLLVGTGLLILFALRQVPLFDNDRLWWSLSYYGLIATGLAFSFRTGTPNLAVGAVAGLSGGLFFTLNVDGSVPALLAGLIALAVSLLAGLVLGLIAGLLSAPAWAVSLAGYAVVQGAVFSLINAGDIGRVGAAGIMPAPLDRPYSWLGLFLAVSLLGGILFAIPALRRLGVHRAASEARFQGRYLLAAVVGFGGSSLLAGLAGLAMVGERGVALLGGGLLPLFLALGAALIGGVSAFGARGGILGTILGVTLLVVASQWIATVRFESITTEVRQGLLWAVPAAAIVVGVAVNRLMEALVPSRPPLPPAAGAPGQPVGAPGQPVGAPGQPVDAPPHTAPPAPPAGAGQPPAPPVAMTHSPVETLPSPAPPVEVEQPPPPRIAAPPVPTVSDSEPPTAASPAAPPTAASPAAPPTPAATVPVTSPVPPLDPQPAPETQAVDPQPADPQPADPLRAESPTPATPRPDPPQPT